LGCSGSSSSSGSGGSGSDSMMDQENESPRPPVRRRGAGQRGLKTSVSAGNEQLPTGRAAHPAKAEASVYEHEDDTFANEFTDDAAQDDESEIYSEEDEYEMDGVMSIDDLLQASTTESRAKQPTAAKSRMSLGGGLLKPAKRVNERGETVAPSRTRATARPAPKRVRARPSPRKKLQPNPDPLPVVADTSSPEPAPATASSGSGAGSDELLKLFEERSKAPPDLLSLIDSFPDIAEEFDRMRGSSLDSTEAFLARLVESGKLEAWVAKAREGHSTMVTKITSTQKLVYDQWQKCGELELAAASGDALGAQNRCLEREVTGLQNKQTQLESENMTLTKQLKDANQELASMLSQSHSQTQSHSQKLKAMQADSTALEAQLAQAHDEASEAAAESAAELKKIKAALGKQIKDLQAEKDEGLELANDLTQTMEAKLEEAKAETASLTQELEAVKQELENKLAASEDSAGQAQATVSDLKKQLAKEEMEVVKGQQKLEDVKADFERKLAASEKMVASINEAVAAVKEQLSHEQQARSAAEASLKKQTEVTIPAMEQSAGELKQKLADLESTSAADQKTSQDAQEAADQEIALLKGRLHDTTEIASALRKEVNSSKDESQTMGEQIVELKQKLEAAGSSSEELKAQVAAMEAQHVAAGSEKDRLIEQVEEANTLQQRYAQQVEVLGKQMSDTAAALEQLRGDKEAEMAKTAAMAEQFEPLREQVNKLQAEKQGLADENSRMAIRIELLEENSSDAGLAQVSLATDNEFAKKQNVNLVEELEQLRQQVGEQAQQLANMSGQIIDGELLRKKMHNTICELKGNIRVFCRVRPMMDHDGDTGVAALRYPKSTVDDKEAIEVVADEGVKTQFGFDKVFPERSSQLQIFNEVSSLVQSAIDGYRCCIFAYGQTGTGKTHTMQGASGEDRGIIPRSLEMIVAETQRLKLQGWEYTLHASFLEIHNENLRDLLCDPTAPKVDLSIKHLPNGQSLVTNAVEEEIAANAGDIARLMHRAQLQRSVGFTAMNAASSRSHAVFRLRLEGSKEGEDSVSGMLNLIDLAGSERLDKSEATGERLKETQAINKSLSALGNVFFALVNGQGHVPFRDSKLTHLLQPCLGGNCKTLMLSNISPAQSSSGESLCSLRFASRVNKCELGRAKKQVSNGDGGGGGGGGGGGATKRVQPRRKSKVDAAEAAAAAKADKAASKPGRRNTGMANVRPTTAKDSRPARNVRARTGR
jgi:kinesin family protein C1